MQRRIGFKQLSETTQDDIINDFKQEFKRRLTAEAVENKLSYEEFLRIEYNCEDDIDREDYLLDLAKEAIEIEFSGQIAY